MSLRDIKWLLGVSFIFLLKICIQVASAVYSNEKFSSASTYWFSHLLHQVYECGPPPDGENTEKVPSSFRTKIGQSYTYTCLCGYTTGEELVTTCVDGYWTGSPPNCSS